MGMGRKRSATDRFQEVTSGYNNHIQLNGNSNCRPTEDLLDAGHLS